MQKLAVNPRIFLFLICIAGTIFPLSSLAQCLPVPASPTVTCTQTVSNGNVTINAASDVICVTGTVNLNTVDFNAPGTLVIEAGASVSGGITANGGGTLIVKGNFDWNGASNLASGFEIYVDAGGQITRIGDLTLNSTSHQLVNRGGLTITNHLTYLGDVYNTGTLTASGFNLNSNSSRFINTGSATSATFFNVNSGAVVENCGSLDIGVNLEINSGATFVNYCDLIVRDFAQQLSTFENYGLAIVGLNGSGDGFLNQGPTTLHDGSVLVTKDFFWSSNAPITMAGNAAVVVASSTLSPQGQITSLQAPGRLRIAGGASLDGSGTLDLCDADPISAGDNPTAPNVTFPAGVAAQVTVGPNNSLHLRACDPVADLPLACSDTTVNDPCAGTFIAINFVSVEPACNGEGSGELLATVAGGVAPYTYIWSTGDSTPSLAGLTAGNYTLCVADANGCTGKRSVDLLEPAPLGLNGFVTDAGCGLSGRIDGVTAGGTPPYGYLWSNGAATDSIGGISAGTYTVTLTDANNCTVSQSFTVANTAGADATLDCCADTAVCLGSNVDLPVQLTGAGPWTLNYTVDGVPATVTATQSPYIISLTPTAVTTLELTGVSNAACGAGNACGRVTIGVNNCSPCNNPCQRNCFLAEVVSRTVLGSCEEVTLQVTCDGSCRRALSNMTISLPCGQFIQGSTDAGYPVVVTNPAGDPNSGLHGIKVDNISNFCENGAVDTFEVTYQVCFGVGSCGTTSCDPLVAYKAGPCVLYSDVQAMAAGNGMSLRTYPNPGQGPLQIELGSQVGGSARVEVVSALGATVVLEEDLGELAPGETAVYTWDGLGCGGLTAQPGMYLVRVQVGDEIQVARVVRY